MNVGKELTREETNQVHNLLQKYKSVFQLNDNDYGETNITEHSIDTGDAKPLKQRQYRLPQIAKEEITKQVTAMKEAGQIEESNSPLCSPILIVPKKSEDPNKHQFRFWIDFRNVNKVTIKDSYPLPRIDHLLDALAGAYNFSTLDLA